MPTGYTYFLLEHPEATFADFAWKCARAMGFCIMQRDDSSDAAVLVEEQPSDYYSKSLADKRAERHRIADLTDDEWAAEESTRRSAGEANWRESIERSRNEHAIFLSMRDATLQWNCPAELNGMKDFMLDQLKISMHTVENKPDETTKRIFGFKQMSKAEKIADLDRDIAYAKEHLDKEIECVAERNRYKRMLLESIGAPSLVKLSLAGAP